MAIFFDTSTDGGFTAGVTTKTFAHVCAGDILFVGSWGDITNDLVTGATYNNVNMTLVGKALEPTGRWAYMFCLVGPAQGSNVVAINASGSISIAGMAASYIGSSQLTQPDASTTGTAASAVSITTTVLPQHQNDWAVLVARNGTGAAGAGTGATLRKSSANGLGLFDSGGAVNGAYSMTVTNSSSNWGAIMATFSPVSTPVPQNTGLGSIADLNNLTFKSIPR